MEPENRVNVAVLSGEIYDEGFVQSILDNKPSREELMELEVFLREELRQFGIGDENLNSYRRYDRLLKWVQDFLE